MQDSLKEPEKFWTIQIEYQGETQVIPNRRKESASRKAEEYGSTASTRLSGKLGNNRKSKRNSCFTTGLKSEVRENRKKIVG